MVCSQHTPHPTFPAPRRPTCRYGCPNCRHHRRVPSSAVGHHRQQQPHPLSALLVGAPRLGLPFRCSRWGWSSGRCTRQHPSPAATSSCGRRSSLLLRLLQRAVAWIMMRRLVGRRRDEPITLLGRNHTRPLRCHHQCPRGTGAGSQRAPTRCMHHPNHFPRRAVRNGFRLWCASSANCGVAAGRMPSEPWCCRRISHRHSRLRFHFRHTPQQIIMRSHLTAAC